jgi:hypothetical protein
LLVIVAQAPQRGQGPTIKEGVMELTFLGSSSVTGDCPSVYATDRGTYVVQGLKLDPEVLARLTMPERETAVEIPAALLRFLPPEAVPGA